MELTNDVLISLGKEETVERFTLIDPPNNQFDRFGIFAENAENDIIFLRWPFINFIKFKGDDDGETTNRPSANDDAKPSKTK